MRDVAVWKMEGYGNDEIAEKLGLLSPHGGPKARSDSYPLEQRAGEVSHISSPSTVSSSEILQIEQVCDRFEAAWRAGERPRLESHLRSVATPLYARLLHHLVALDWEYRVRAGDEPQAADYVKRFPAVAAAINSIRREVAAVTDADGQPANRLGEYRIIRQVGRGGMGVVYEAIHESLGRRVALKLMPGIDLANPTARERFCRGGT